MNDRGEVAFVADLTTGGEGVFIVRRGEIVEVMRSGDAAPGGGLFEGVAWADTAISDRGDVTFAFSLSPFSLPFGVNSGLYRYSAARESLGAIVVPGVTLDLQGVPFAGVTFTTSVNNAGDIAFAGIIPTDEGIHIPGEDYIGLGQGVYRLAADGRLSAIARPGDPAPGGGTFDYAAFPSMNDRGDIAFDGHVAGKECLDLSSLGLPQAFEIQCLASIYLSTAPSHNIRLIARQGDPAPKGGFFRWISLPKINEWGDIAFFADLIAPPNLFGERAVFLYSRGQIVPVVRPGDVMPGGGHVVTAFWKPANFELNDRGEVSFHAVLDTDLNEDGHPDTGLYVWSRGEVRLVAHTGTTIPGVGVIAHLVFPDLVGTPFYFGAEGFNNHGQVVVQATLTDGRGVMLLAAPA